MNGIPHFGCAQPAKSGEALENRFPLEVFATGAGATLKARFTHVTGYFRFGSGSQPACVRPKQCGAALARGFGSRD
jgi:hypothetical protein